VNITTRTAIGFYKLKYCILVRTYKDKHSYGLRQHNKKFEKQEEAWLVFWSRK